MRLIDITLSNLRRRKGKVLFLISGLIIAVATVVSLISLTNAMHADIQDKIDQFGANIIITPKSDEFALAYGGVTIATTNIDAKELHISDIETIKTIENSGNIAIIAPKLVGAVNLDAGKALMVGVDFPSELKLKQWWEITGNNPSEQGQMLVGSAASSKFGLMPGSQVRIGDRTLEVSGVLNATGSVDDSMLFTDLPTAQSVLGKPNSLSLIEVSALCKACPIEDIIAQISDKLPDTQVDALAQTIKSREQTVDQITSFSVAVSAVVLIISALIVLTTMMSSVNERTREIGIFRAIGFRREHIMRIIMSETLFTSALGGAVGWLAGMLVSVVIGQRFLDTGVIHWDPWLAPTAIGLAILVGIASSVYPAMRAARLDPVEALRFI